MEAEYSLNTAQNIYRAVLDGIKRESTAVLTPETFNRLINQSAIYEWLKSKSIGVDFNQHHVDALRNLIRRSKDLPLTTNGKIGIPFNYYRLLSVEFSLLENNHIVWKSAKRLKSDNVSVATSNPYRKPTDDRIYYFQEGDFIVPYENTNVKGARLFYIALPDPIVYNHMNDAGSSHGELLPEQNKELVDICVRIYLERVKEERYQTILAEENLKENKFIH